MSSDDSDNSPNVSRKTTSDAILANDDENTLRILLSTDNHLGYAERDPVRGNDSFAAFEEVLYLAKKFNCDMVLIAGDLFHENRPSRRTLHKTIEIIRRYCMGPGAVRIQILSDQAENFRNPVTGVVNYQDPYYSIDLPIFSIHGNHDDPSRDSGGELLAALDLLAVSNLVNYFGRQEQVDRIEISPILIQKGDTKVALYGLGSMRDERLNRMWENKKVRFLRPEEDEGDEEDSDSFFNIFTLHQNRDLGRGGKNCIQESMIPEWMDLVIWGHEHECLIEFFESVVGTFRITQPGSSVATSLVSGEAARKKVGVLDINGKNFRLHPVPLTQIRSFVTTEISLQEHRSGLDPDDPKIETKVMQILQEEVQLVIRNARQKTKELLQDARMSGNDITDEGSPVKYTIEKPDEVLVRVRVEHMGFSTLNNQRFGAKFVGEVANPGDILLFHRKKDAKLASTAVKKSIQPIAPEELEKTNMEDLVKEQLEAPDRKLKLLEEHELSEAMEDYVEKSLAAAIPEKAHSLLKKKQMRLIKGQVEHEAQNDMTQVEQPSFRDLEVLEHHPEADKRVESGIKRRQEEVDSVNASEEENENDNFRHREVSKRSTKKQAAPKTTRVGVQGKRRIAAHKAEDDIDEDASEPSPTRRSQRASRKQVSYGDEPSYAEDVESEDEVELTNKSTLSSYSRKVPPSQRKRSTAGTAVKRTAKKTLKHHKLGDSDEDDGGIVDDNDDLDDDWGTAVKDTRRFR